MLPPLDTTRRRRVGRLLALMLGSVLASLALLPVGQAAAACETLPTTTLTRTISAEIDCYTTTSTFTRKVRTRVVRQSSTGSVHKPLLQKWVRADGTTVCATATDSPRWCTLPAGSYQLRVRNSAPSTTASYTLNVVTPQTQCNSVGFGSPISTTIGVGQTKCISIAGADLRWHLEALTTTGFRPASEIVWENGDPLCARTLAIDFVCKTGSRNGEINLLIESASGRGKATVGLSGRWASGSCGYTIPTDGSIFNDGGYIRNIGNLSILGQVQCRSFNAVAGATYDVVTQPKPGRNRLRTQVIAPDGSVVCGPATTKSVICTTPTSGLYVIQTSAAPTTPYGPNYGEYTVTVKQQPAV